MDINADVLGKTDRLAPSPPSSSLAAPLAALRSLVSQLEAVVPSQPCVPIGCHLPMDLGPRDTEEVWQWCARVSPSGGPRLEGPVCVMYFFSFFSFLPCVVSAGPTFWAFHVRTHTVCFCV